jgi:hypothetical protein
MFFNPTMQRKDGYLGHADFEHGAELASIQALIMTSALAKRSAAPAGHRHRWWRGGTQRGDSTAVTLGYGVTVLERAATPGGKMRQIVVGGKAFRRGPERPDAAMGAR